LLLDEPINGLDPQAIVEVRNLFERLNKENGITILISSHILEELAKVATQFAIIDKGQILEELTREELLTKGTNEVIVGCSDVDLAESALKSSGFTSIRKEGKESIVIGDSNADVASINKILIEKSISINSIGTKSEGIEDYYLRLTSRKV
jgi:ABC-type multidrug transport system ATPase subunit